MIVALALSLWIATAVQVVRIGARRLVRDYTTLARELDPSAAATQATLFVRSSASGVSLTA